MKSFKGYTFVNTTAKIERDAQGMLEKSLKDAYIASKCIIAPNGDEDRKFATEVQIFQKWDADGEAMKVIGRIGEIERGNYIYYKDQVWLVTTKPEDNGTFRKAEMYLCSTVFPIKEDDKKIITGLDDVGRPIYEIIPGKVLLMPCVPKMNDASTAIADVNKPINELDNIVTITIPYKEAPSIKHDEIFTLFDQQYRIIRLDYSKSIEKIGIIKITGERLGRDER